MEVEVEQPEIESRNVWRVGEKYGSMGVFYCKVNEV